MVLETLKPPCATDLAELFITSRTMDAISNQEWNLKQPKKEEWALDKTGSHSKINVDWEGN